MATYERVDIDHAAKSAWDNGNTKLALELWDNLLDDCVSLPDSERYRIERNRRFAISQLDTKFSEYPFEVIEKLSEKKSINKTDYDVTFVILTCKRFDLFTRTMNSFLAHCTDLHFIKRWICVDDNSHQSERDCMKVLYPFFEFVWKLPEQSGHAKSLNILQTMVDTPFVLALEDDWLFVKKTNYIERCFSIFANEPEHLSQVLFNRHYIEIPDDGYLSVKGGIFKKDLAGRRYILHEYIPETTPEYKSYCEKFPYNFARQPHFALRPSLFKRSVWKKVGLFNASPLIDFEFQYAQDYAASGLTSAYFDGVYSIHTGRLNREKANPNAEPNAYQLNNQPQYGYYWNSNRTKDGAQVKKLLLSVTTCKRLEIFRKSIKTCLSMCRDIKMIDKFLCVDDNSSEEDRKVMQKEFPFFQFIYHDSDKKGHAKSMNEILEFSRQGNYSYLFHVEDDWNFLQPYSIGDCVDLIEHFNFGQVVLRWHGSAGPCKAELKKFESTDKNSIVYYREHEHDPLDKSLPSYFQHYKKDFVTLKSSYNGCWWPSVTFNPGVWNLNLFYSLDEKFNESIDPSYFEYEISLKLALKNFKMAYLDKNMNTFPSKTAYLLNDELRLFDGNGCDAHRSFGGDTSCQSCIDQKREFEEKKKGGQKF